MRVPFFMAMIFLTINSFGQNPYSKLNISRGVFREIKVEKEQATEFFDYAVWLSERDSLRKAGEIFHKIYLLDSVSKIGVEALSRRNKIEERVLRETQEILNSVWVLLGSGSNWGHKKVSATEPPSRMELDGTTIRFYRNDSLVRETKYDLTQFFLWELGWLAIVVQYEDTKEEWNFSFGPWGAFTSDRLVIEERTKYVCGNYHEVYERVVKQ